MPGDERCRDALHVGAIGEPFRVHVPAVQEEPRGLVLLDIAGAAHLGQLPKASPAPQMDLNQPVTRGVEAPDEVRVVLRPRKVILQRRPAGEVIYCTILGPLPRH